MVIPTYTLVAASFVLVVALLGFHYFSQVKFPADIPRVRENGRTSFSWRTRLAYYTDCEALYREAYENYSKNGKTCIVPGLGFRNDVILPRNSIQWLNAEPSSKIDRWAAFNEVDQAEWSLGHKNFFLDEWAGILMAKNIHSSLERMVLPMNDELQVALEQLLGTDTKNWKDVQLLRTVQLLVAQASSRFTVGKSLCRNEKYLTDTLAFMNHFVINAGVVGAMPFNFLRQIAGRCMYAISQYYLRNISRDLKSLFDEHVKVLDTESKSIGKKPFTDQFMNMLEFAKENRPKEFNLHDITVRLCITNFGSIHQTSFALTNLLFNIVASDAEYNTISLIRDEIRGIFGTEKPVWTKAACSKMVKLDSTIRETLRLQSFANRGMLRIVAAKDGIRTQDGCLLPYGALISFVTHPAQTDGEVFEDPLKFDPFRFSRVREAAAAAELDPTWDSDSVEKKNKELKQSMVATGQHFLLFGHGKHACPGRHLLDFEAKMMVAHLLTNYDLTFPKEYNGMRPKTAWLAEATFPSATGKLSVKRRNL